MELRKVSHDDIAELRQEKIGSFHVPLFPTFHMHLAQHAEAIQVSEEGREIGYALLLFDRHEDHEHVTLIEMYLTPPFRDRYEDALDRIQEEFEPRAYLARSDDCPYHTALIAFGFPMETSMSVMVARTAPQPPDDPALDLVPLDYAYLRDAHDIYAHVRGTQEAPTVGELEQVIGEDRVMVLTWDKRPVALLIQEESEGRNYGLMDILAPHVSDEHQVWALEKAGHQFMEDGLTPAAVIDGRDVRKIKVFRKAGYYTAATYLIFYDPEAGRPHVPVIDRDELWGLIEGGAEVRVVDVMGQAHWERGHLPTAEWIDYRRLSQEARRRFEDKDEPIVVYCNDYT